MRLALLLFAAYAFAAWNDAQRPDSRRLHYMVDYWGDMLDIKKAGHTLQGLVELLGAE